MKKGIFIVMFATFALIANAQSDYSNYLNKALEKLEAGDCEAAQKNYDLYKELSGEVKNSVQVMIDDCQKTKTKKYTLGELIIKDYYVNGEKKANYYKVAWLNDTKEHGFAVCSGGSPKFIYSSEMYNYTGGHLITLDELVKIIPNKNAIQMSGVYWTSTIANATSDWGTTTLWVVDVESKIRKAVERKRIRRKGDAPLSGYSTLYVIEF